MQPLAAIGIVLATGLLTLLPAYTFAQNRDRHVDLNPKDNRSYSEREQARGMAEAQKGYEHTQQEKEREQMRDKTHDGRLPVGKDSSVGAQTNPPGINYRTTTK